MRRSKVKRLVQSLGSWEEGLARLGECIVEFQRIEDSVAICISALLGRSRKVGEIVTAEMSFRARVAVYGALFAHCMKAQALPKDIQDLISRLHWAEEMRNTLVHSLWDASELNPDSILRKKKAVRRSTFSVSEEYYTPEELEELHGLFEGIVTDLFYLTSEHLPNMEKRLLRP